MKRSILVALLAALPAAAYDVMMDPWVPPHVKGSESYVETRGEGLRKQVEQKLRRQFEAADPARSGTLTREQARAAGLGYIADNFDAIDRSRAGVVRFDDVRRYLSETTRDAARANPGAAR
jgi:hypothetical protein